MRIEHDVPIGERFLMILGKLSAEMIRQIEEERMPTCMARMRNQMDAGTVAEWNRFAARDRSLDHAFYTLYAYAEIPLGRCYDGFFHKADHELIPVRSRIEHAIYEGWFPVRELAHGHKHVIFLSTDSPVPVCVPSCQKWEEAGEDGWLYGICDRPTLDARRVELSPSSPSHYQPTRKKN